MLAKVMMMICLACVAYIIYNIISGIFRSRKRRAARRKLIESQKEKSCHSRESYFDAIVAETMKHM